MSEHTSSLGEEWRSIRGWVPWLIAGVYFPLYVVVDLVAGGLFGSLFGLPRSVSVALVSLTIALVVAAVVIVTRLDGLTASSVVDALHPRRSGPTRGRSTVGPGGAVNRRTVDADGHSHPTSDARRTPPGRNGEPTVEYDGGVTSQAKASAQRATSSGPASTPDGTGPAGSEDVGHDGGDEWPDEWIPGDEL